MRKEHDFTQAPKNPHAKRLKRQITIPYQSLITLYLVASLLGVIHLVWRYCSIDFFGCFGLGANCRSPDP
jgi:hypothetical protein